MHFTSTILIIPGLGNSGPQHWQSLWEKQYNFTRVEQQNWDEPVCSDWVETLNNFLKNYNLADVILVGHSSACAAIVYWAQKFNIKIKGALLVGPSDTEADTYPAEATGFNPMPLNRLPFPSITVASQNDYYVSFDRATLFAQSWGSELVNIGDAGHVNVASGFGEWPQGLELLKRLDGL
jgi:predicted alpha/beta hydrolase family esterase